MKQVYQHPHTLILESGEALDHLTIAYHTFGKLNEKRDNVIWVFHALTGNSDVSSWWSSIFGEHQVLDPTNYFIVCANVIGSPYGSSCPKDLSFPFFTIRDICQAHQLLAAALEINHIHLCIGGSFGGDQALEFAYSYSGKIKHLVLIASCAKESAWAIAVHETQRMALRADPTFGADNSGLEGMKAARAIGMLTYRTSQLYIDKQTDTEEKFDDFSASSYIQHQGNKFADRFSALSYYYLTKCLDSHDIGRFRGGLPSALAQINVRTLVIGINSDILIPSSLQKEMATLMPQAEYQEIHSDTGHDGFLIEGQQLNQIISTFLNQRIKAYVVHKFGGKSLANGTPLKNVLDICEKQTNKKQHVIVVSARGKTTDELVEVYHKASQGLPYESDLNHVLEYQTMASDAELTPLRQALTDTLSSIAKLQFDHVDLKNRVIAFGELFSAHVVAHELRLRGLDTIVIDARSYIKTYAEKGEDIVDIKLSRKLLTDYFATLSTDVTPIVTGFISSDEQNKTTNLGRNGSNYTASLVASFIDAEAVYNWTDIDGIYSANPKLVKNAKVIPHLSFREAYELANFGANVLHAKTILPLLDKNIPLFVKSSNSINKEGTRIDQLGASKGIKVVSVIEDTCLVALEGSGLSGRVGIDARIFSCLSANGISVRLISQASTERGIGFVVDARHAKLAQKQLHQEFKDEISQKSIASITINPSVSIIAITGRHNYALEKAIEGLRKNNIWIHLFSNSINGENISLVIDNKYTEDAINIVHDYVM